MKCAHLLFLFLPLWLLLCGCPSDIPNQMQALRKNHYDFPGFRKKNFGDLYFDCPGMLVYNYNKDFLYKKDGISLYTMDLGIFLSVEKFTKPEAEKFIFYFDQDQGITLLDAVHEHYMQERRKSLKYFENSIRTSLPEKSKLPGSMEVIYGRPNDYGEDLKYMIATVEKGESWYVFQFVTSHDMASYLFDDFKKIIQSAR